MVKKENMKNLKSEIQNPLMKWDALNKKAIPTNIVGYT